MPVAETAERSAPSTKAPTLQGQSAPSAKIQKKGEGGVGVQVALLRKSQEALRQGRPGVSLARLQEHEARFPSTPLLQERQAGRVFALCALGRTEQARREATAFVARFPQSPLQARVLRACGTEGSEE